MTKTIILAVVAIVAALIAKNSESELVMFVMVVIEAIAVYNTCKRVIEATKNQDCR